MGACTGHELGDGLCPCDKCWVLRRNQDKCLICTDGREHCKSCGDKAKFAAKHFSGSPKKKGFDCANCQVM